MYFRAFRVKILEEKGFEFGRFAPGHRGPYERWTNRGDSFERRRHPGLEGLAGDTGHARRGGERRPLVPDEARLPSAAGAIVSPRGGALGGDRNEAPRLALVLPKAREVAYNLEHVPLVCLSSRHPPIDQLGLIGGRNPPRDLPALVP